MAGLKNSGWARGPRTALLLLAELAGFAGLLFLTRFVARGHLIALMDQECHIGGIATELLAHGIRFPLLAYAPNEYDNGSFFSGVLAAASFSLLGQSVLALKLVTHGLSAAAAVAALWLLRGCLEELGLTRQRERWAAIAALVAGLALAPRVVTLFSMYAVGNHAEGAAIVTILVALFARRLRRRSAGLTAAFWALVGLCAYLNKGTFLVIPLFAAVELLPTWRTPRRIAAALAGLAAGAAPELLVVVSREARGWGMMGAKAARTSHEFPRAFLDSLATLGEHRLELLVGWALAIVVGALLLFRALARWRATAGAAPAGPAAPGAEDPGAPPPLSLGLALGVTGLNLAALTVMGKGGLDSYVLYGYPSLVVLAGVAIAAGSAAVTARWGSPAGAFAGAAALLAMVAAGRPDAVELGGAQVAALRGNGPGAACSWRFAEGFGREHDHGLAPPGRSRVEHVIERCRSLHGEDQVLDCVGGIGRELHWRGRGRVAGEPPPSLTAPERRAYAFQYGTHRRGDETACADFASPELQADCRAAVGLDCLGFGDVFTRYLTGEGLRRPRCELPEPPMGGFWAEKRLELLSRTAGTSLRMPVAQGDDDLGGCAVIFQRCF